MLQQQLMQMQQMMHQQEMENIQEKGEQISVNFHKEREKCFTVNCSLKDPISDVIKKYRKYSLDNSQTEKFIFNAKALYPSLTVAEAGLSNGSNIFVVETKGVRGR